MMSPVSLSVVVFALIAGAAVFVSLSHRHKSHALSERLVDMKMKMRVGNGTLAPEDIEAPGVANALFRWALERLPQPQLDTPEGKKIQKLLVRAGYFGFRAPRMFQVIRVGSAVGATAIALLASL